MLTCAPTSRLAGALVAGGVEDVWNHLSGGEIGGQRPVERLAVTDLVDVPHGERIDGHGVTLGRLARSGNATLRVHAHRVPSRTC